MKLARKIALLQELNDYLGSDAPAWLDAKEKASRANGWFTPAFIDLAVTNIRRGLLPAQGGDNSNVEFRISKVEDTGAESRDSKAQDPNVQFRNSKSEIRNPFQDWLSRYDIPESQENPLTVGLIMAGNIPLVGFHDFICVFLSGHQAHIKASSKDDVLIRHIVEWMQARAPELQESIRFRDMLQGCDAYIATGSDNSARYFEHYFAKYPHIIRRNRTSVAILDGSETPEELSALADDIHQYFGLGCRNVTQLLVPEGYDFVPLLEALKRYDDFLEHAKYKHNFDYNLTIQIMNNQYYMTNGSVVLVQNPSPFSPIGQLNYQFYSNKDSLSAMIQPDQVQCIVGHGHTPFGQAQCPGPGDYADGVDTMQFLTELVK